MDKLKTKRLNAKAKPTPKDPEDNPILMSLFEQVLRNYGDLQIEDYKYIIKQIEKYPKYFKLFSGKSVYKVVPASEFPKAKKGSKLIFRRKSGFTNLCTRWFHNIYGAQNAIEYGLGSEYGELESFTDGEPLLILVAKTSENASKQWLDLSNVAKYLFEGEEGENIFYPGPVVCSVLKITQADSGW